VTVKPTTDTPTFPVVPPPPKKKRRSKVAPSLPKIACVACGHTDVPLIMGGRYCRPCAGLEPQTYSGMPQNGGTFMHKFWAGPNPGQSAPHQAINPQPVFSPQATFNPRPAINPQPINNPPTQPTDLQPPPTAPTVPKRKKLPAKDPNPPTQPKQLSSSSSKKKRSK